MVRAPPCYVAYLGKASFSRSDHSLSLSLQTLRGLYTQAHNNLRSIAKSAHELDAVSEDASGSEHEVRSPPLIVSTSGGVFGS